MNGQQEWELVARNIGFPVAVVANGVTDLPRISQSGGDLRSLKSVTVSYDRDGVQVTTYREVMWGGELAEVWRDLLAFVESSYGYSWEAWGSKPQDEDHATQARRQRAATMAEHRVVELPLSGSPVQATVVGASDIWSAGFETAWKGRPLVVLLSGRSIAVDSLGLELVDDLLGHLQLANAERH
jgi:hypothetical protein